MLESARDPFNVPWWSVESSVDASPRRNSTSSIGGLYGSRLMESDYPSNELDLALEGAGKELTWISKHKASARNSAGNPSIQNGSVQGRFARFAVPDSPGRGIQIPYEMSALQIGSAQARSARFVVPDSPGRGIFFPPDSPARRGESVRQIRTPSMDLDMTQLPSCATPSRRTRSANQQPRSAFFQEYDLTVARSDRTVVREASAIRRTSTSRAAGDQGILPKPQIPFTTNDSSRFTPISDAPESDRQVVSYLAEETERIIKARTRKLTLRPQHSNGADQLRTTDSERISAGEEVRTPNGVSNGGRNHGSSSFRQIDKTNAERVDSRDNHREHLAGGIQHQPEHESDRIHARRPGTLASSPGPPRLSYTTGEGDGPTRMMSATMENYLESRRKGSNLGPQILVSSRPAAGRATSPTASHPNLTVLRQMYQPENPSTSSKTGAGSRYDNFTASRRAALSPLNGNEGVTHPMYALPQSKDEHGEDPNRRRRKDSNESIKIEGENGFPSRLQYWAEFLGKRELHTSEVFRHLTQESAEEVISPSGRKGLGAKTAPVRLHSNGVRRHSSPEKRQMDSYDRNTAPGAISQRYEDVGRSLLSDKGLGSGRRESPRRSQSCRRDAIIHPLFEASVKNEALSGSKPVLPSGLDTSSDSKSSRRFSVDMQLSSSSDTIQEQSSFLAQAEKSKFIFKNSPDHKSSRWSAVPVPPSGETTLSGSGDSLQEPPQCPAPVNKPRHQRSASRANMTAPHKDSDSQPQEEKKYLQLERPRMLHRTSLSLDDDTYKKVFVHTEPDNNRSGQPVSSSTSTSVSLDCSAISPRTTKPYPSSPRGGLQRWIASQFKLGSRSRSSSAAKTREPQQEQKERMERKEQKERKEKKEQKGRKERKEQKEQKEQEQMEKEQREKKEQMARKKSPWRTRPAEIFQVITRKKGSSTRSQAVQLLDANGLQNLRQQNLSESETQSQLNLPEPWHRRMKDPEDISNSAPFHRRAYFLPPVVNPSPARSRGLPSLFRSSRTG